MFFCDEMPPRIVSPAESDSVERTPEHERRRLTCLVDRKAALETKERGVGHSTHTERTASGPVLTEAIVRKVGAVLSALLPPLTWGLRGIAEKYLSRDLCKLDLLLYYLLQAQSRSCSCSCWTILTT